MRTQRVMHNHIFQGVTQGCPACALMREGISTRFAVDLLRQGDPMNILGTPPQPAT